MNQRVLQRFLVSPILLFWPSLSRAFRNGRATITRQHRLFSSTTASTDADDDYDSDAYWTRQIHRQGEERQEYRWFREKSSLPFDCTACGKCCKTKGQVYMTPEEHTHAAELLGISKEEFIQQYASHTLEDETNGELWLRLVDRSAHSDDHGCVFLQEDNTCRIYEARPIQCSTYPFWPNILSSEQAWNKEVRRADDDQSGERQGLPKWTVEGGGCEGMRLIRDEEDEDAVGVPREQVYEQVYWYEYDERRFPRSKENPKP